MILNVSGRTDIVAFYTPWFIKRYKCGFVDVRNPIYPKLVSRINFKDVDLIVFCTKNPKPIIDFLPEITQPIIFHVTITPYKEDIEPNVKNKKEVIEDVKKIVNILGTNRVYVRYDPIFLNPTYTLDYHIKAFNKLCKNLNGYVTKIIVSFVDDYQNVRKNMDVLKIKNFTKEEKKTLALAFSEIARNNNMTIQTCSEYDTLEDYGFIKGECLSRDLAKSLTGKNYPEWKSRNNQNCHCASMVDIGEYNTCSHLCKYCYANFNEEKVMENKKHHNPNSSLLIKELKSDDEIKIRKK